MKSVILPLAAWLCTLLPTEATLILIDLSPAGGTALNAGATTYNGDHAVGLAAPNALGQPASSATGNEVGAGITFDDVSLLLSFDFAYGSAFGFTDLAGNYTTSHIHGPASTQFRAANTGAGVQVSLDSFHTASGSNSGRITGSVVLTAAQATDLKDNELYINVHSTVYVGGEIRAQLIAVPEPSSALLLLLGGLLLRGLRMTAPNPPAPAAQLARGVYRPRC